MISILLVLLLEEREPVEADHLIRHTSAPEIVRHGFSDEKDNLSLSDRTCQIAATDHRGQDIRQCTGQLEHDDHDSDCQSGDSAFD